MVIPKLLIRQMVGRIETLAAQQIYAHGMDLSFCEFPSRPLSSLSGFTFIMVKGFVDNSRRYK